MSKSSKSKSSADKQMQEQIAQFCAVTGAPVKDAKRFLEKHKRVDVAIDAYYNDPSSMAAAAKRFESSGHSASKLSDLFDRYKDPDGPDITVDGTIKWCEDLGVNPEDVVFLAVAFELKSPRIGQWNKKGWVDGWKNLGCDSIPSMKSYLPRLRDRLGSDSDYFQKVYNHTFDFGRMDGQRSLAIDTAESFWGLLLPHGLSGGALCHVHSIDGDDDDMGEEEGWRPEYVEWWLEFLTHKGGKGVSKDTWVMFFDFVRTIDANFENYDLEGSWPSTIDDFVQWAKERLARSAI